MNKKSWQWLAGLIATVFTSVATVLLAFPAVVERVLNTFLDNVTAMTFDKGVKRQSTINEITTFDIRHSAYSGVVVLLPDFGFKVIWLNPAGSHFWQQKRIEEGGIEYPDFESLKDLRENHCIESKKEAEPVYACLILGQSHVIVSFPIKDDVNEKQFKSELSLLAGRIDRIFMGF